MGLVALRCPHCDGEIQLDDSKEFGFCMYCGSRVVMERRTDRVSIDESSKVMSLVDTAFQYKDEGMEADAYAYAKKALDIDPSEPQAWYVVGFTSPRPEERMIALRRAADLFEDEEIKAALEEAYAAVRQYVEERRDGKVALTVVSEMTVPFTLAFDGEERRVEPGESYRMRVEPGYHCFEFKDGRFNFLPDNRLYKTNCTVRLCQTRTGGAYLQVEENRPPPLRKYTVPTLRQP